MHKIHNKLISLLFILLLTNCGDFGKIPTKAVGIRIYQSSKFPEINYDGTNGMPNRNSNEATNEIYTKESYMYIYIGNRLYPDKKGDYYLMVNRPNNVVTDKDINFMINFMVNNSCTENRLYYIKKEDVYLLKNDGTKIPVQMQASGIKDLDSIGSECSIDRVSYLSGKTLLKYKWITFPLHLWQYLENDTKLVIAKVYKNDKVIMQNIEYSFDIHKFDHVNPYWNRKVNIKLPQ
ncbi:hypothetical protein [Candidatus Deianiraea vastatrix]|uniref:Uncharacterized protein n=1 Tax=Candidatus Deianiraea vastatrix TaxID=2163644 RepID=A0A5B8XCH3_9RICK|nr:hypothetical protein [Candidatus Deianiraea vastatrix]QED23049.1 hypothetical protein Deia_00241 [Candidatus Deianiraea vastatrix]